MAAPGELVLGADTDVALGRRHPGQAGRRRPGARVHRAPGGPRPQVVGGFAFADDDGIVSGVEVTTVRFRPAGAALIDWYVERGEWRGAGGRLRHPGRRRGPGGGDRGRLPQRRRAAAGPAAHAAARTASPGSIPGGPSSVIRARPRAGRGARRPAGRRATRQLRPLGRHAVGPHEVREPVGGDEGHARARRRDPVGVGTPRGASAKSPARRTNGTASPTHSVSSPSSERRSPRPRRRARAAAAGRRADAACG